MRRVGIWASHKGLGALLALMMSALLPAGAGAATIDVPGDYATIQAAVNAASAGDEIHVAAGFFTEQVHVTKNDISIVGAGLGSTVIQCPTGTLAQSFTTGANTNYPIVFADGVTGFSLSGLTVDGDRQGNANYRFIGVAFWNSSGWMQDVKVLRITNNPISGAQHGVGVYAYNNAPGSYSVSLTDVWIEDYQKNGTALMGDGLTVDLLRVTAVGWGPTEVTAQNGIQIGYGAAATVRDCVVSDHMYTGSGWASTGILLYGASGTVSVVDCELTDNFPSVYLLDGDATFTRTKIAHGDADAGDGFYAYNSTSAFRGEAVRALPSPFDEREDYPRRRGDMAVALDACEVIGNSAADSWGVGGFGTGSMGVDLTITGSIVSGWDYGVLSYYNGSSYPAPVHLTLHDCDLSGNTSAAVAHLYDAQVADASGNWWGASTPAGVAARIYGPVDYTPWLHSGGNTADPGFQGDFSVLWVDDDSPQTGATGRIQEGIDLADGSTVYVAEGTYREQVKIDGKSVDLRGAGIGSSVIEAVDLGDRQSYSVTQWNGSARSVDACLGVVGPATVHISGFTIDGRELGPDNFYGIHFFDADGKVSGCRIEDIVDASHPSRSRIVSLVATHGEDNGFDVEFSNNLIPNMQKGGILLMGPEGQCRLEGNRVEDEPNAALAGNGIQVSYGCRGVLVDNEVSGVDYVGDNWGASGVLLFEPGDVSVSGGTIVDCEMGLNHSQWNWVYTPAGATAIDVSGILVSGGDYGVSTHLGGPGAELDLTVKESRIVGCAYSGVDLWGSDEDPWGGDYYAGWTDGELTALVEGCYIACGEGVVEWVALEPNTVDVTVRDCHLGDDNDYGVYNNYGNTVDARHNWWGHVDGPTLVRQAGSAASPAALPSPFPAGDAEPDMGFAMPPRPRAESEPSRAGVNVSTGVEFDPWRTGNIVCVPDPLFLSVAQPNGDVTVRYLGGGGGLVYGYSVKFAWDGAVVTTGTAQVTEGGLLRDVAGTDGTHFEKRPTGTNEITVDCVLLGDVDGATGPGDMFTVHFTGAAYGQSPVDLTVAAVRDKNNQPLGGFYADDGLIQVDLTDPSVTDVFIENVTLTHTDDWVKDGDAVKVTATVTDDGPLTITADLTGLGGGAAVAPDSYAGNVATWNLASVACAPADGTVTVTVTATDGLSNSANGSDTITADNTKPEALAGLTAMPGHKKVSLAWSDASSKDANYAGVLLRYDRWNGYPTYAPPAPAYPATHAGGLGTAFAGTGTSTDHAFTAFDRDIYYYGGFVYDQARNYSDADAGAQARATNYWLGDVVPNNNWNGYVDTQDISALGGTYYGYTNPQCDVGPTHNGSRRGVPVPSGTIDFEDLMIFAMNYGVVAPQALPPVGVPPTETTGAVALRLVPPASVAPGAELSVPVYLEDARGVVQGVHFAVGYDARTLQYLGAQPGALVQGCGESFFMPVVHEGLPVVDAAALGDGATFGRSGELAVLRFRCTGEGSLALRLEGISARNVLNEDLFAETSDVVSGPEARIPAEVFLGANRPNPAQGGTGIVFGLPGAAEVRLAVYDVSGRAVRTLVSGSLAAGEHAIVWDGRDEGGRAVSGGVYLYRLETQGRTITRKMVVTE